MHMLARCLHGDWLIRKPTGPLKAMATIEYTDSSGTHSEQFDEIIVATQASQALNMLPRAGEDLHDALRGFKYERR